MIPLELRTERLLLRQWRDEDAEPLAEINAQPEFAALECWRRYLDDPELISITTPANVRSRAVMERRGLTFRGETRWHGHDVVWYALAR